MELECYPMTATPPDLVPGRQSRNWMDAFASRHPYRCLPLTMANTTGWELLCPLTFTAEWNGGPSQADIVITPIEHRKVETMQPVIRSLESSPVMHGQFEAWNRAQTDFNTRLASGDPDAAREAWQRYYFKGEIPEDLGTAPETHVNKRRLKSPRIG